MIVRVDNPVLIIGESAVGKSHYGGQLLKRLMLEEGTVRMMGAATNLEPFQETIAHLDEGLTADHTATNVYSESVWPVNIGNSDQTANLIWPDYAGEQVENLVRSRRIPRNWVERITNSSAWLLLIRLQNIRVEDDVFSRPLSSLPPVNMERQYQELSDQARLIELLQILTYIRSTSVRSQPCLPPLLVLLTCWDEMETPGTPVDELRIRLPLFTELINCFWQNVPIMGLSALGRTLHKEKPDREYIDKGSERFGYVVLKDGTYSTDLTIPIQILVDLIS